MKDYEESFIIDTPSNWEREWKYAGMPEYNQQDLNPIQSIVVHFPNLDAREEFLRLLGHPARTNTSLSTKWTWFPYKENTVQTDRKEKPRKVPQNKYPIYIVSKGRWEARVTVRELEALGIDYKIVVEPQEFNQYASVIDPDKILKLPYENYGEGCSIPARNWIWKHSKKSGAKRHWVLDDNINGFYCLNHNQKPKIKTFNPFSVVEKFTDAYRNVGLSGMNYEFFVMRLNAHAPYTLNTRVYSCILIDNSLPFRWRGRYNEDTDLSLNVLKSGLCTVLFNHIVAKKIVTMKMKGGNTDQLYVRKKGFDGRLEMAKALCELHPDVSRITWKWNRWQHQVDYTPFKRNRLIRK
jgi:hypothetical protein